MKKHYSFPDIQQYREIVKEVQFHSTYTGKDEKGEPIYDSSLPKPTVNFKGTVKLHGRNCSLVLLKDGALYTQSREVVFAPGLDSNGFVDFIDKKDKNQLIDFIKLVLKTPRHSDHLGLIEWDFKEYIAIFGNGVVRVYIKEVLFSN